MALGSHPRVRGSADVRAGGEQEVRSLGKASTPRISPPSEEKNQSINSMRTTAKTRVTRKSPMVFSTVYPFRYPVASTMPDAVTTKTP